MPTDQTPALLAALRSSREPLRAQDLAARLGVSQPTISRALRRAGDEIVRIGRARASRYALAREIARAGSRWPLYRITAAGSGERLGELRAIRAEGFHLEPERALPALMRGEFVDGLYPGLPWFLDDQRPQGFLGRAFASRYGEELDAPRDVLRWDQQDVLLALLRHGENMPGDLVAGEASLERALQHALAPDDIVDLQDRAQRYPALAEAALRGEVPGSSAAGERPKFLATLSEPDGLRSVLVKFSDRNTTPAGQRWADLLRCEKLAGDALRAHGLPAAHADIVQADGRTFMQSTRFDRTPTLGRLGFVSLAALDAAFYGHAGVAWWRLATTLQRDRWITADDAQRMRTIGLFGALIANSDMHLGNVALMLKDDAPLALAPTYDMLPMQFIPAASGEIVARDYLVTLPLPEHLAEWQSAATAAQDFWQRVQNEPAISEGFRSIAASAAIAINRARERFG
jgi:DNA-binding transcriptional ArsR family regulator